MSYKRSLSPRSAPRETDDVIEHRDVQRAGELAADLTALVPADFRRQCLDARNADAQRLVRRYSGSQPSLNPVSDKSLSRASFHGAAP